MSALFPLGQIVAEPGALAALERAKQPPIRLSNRLCNPDLSAPS
jgi:hypothetical protein